MTHSHCHPWLSPRVVSVVGVLILLACAVASLLSGSVAIGLNDIWRVWVAGEQGTAATVLNDIRLPRVLLGGLVGALLAASGAVTQGLFRNPLADPSLLGVTAGASAGGGVMIALASGGFASAWGLGLVSAGAFVGGMLAVLLVYRLATDAQGTSVATMLLAGIAISALAGSITSLLEFVADNALLRRISLWKMGGLDGATGYRVHIALLACVVFFVWVPRYSTALNVLLLGESEARHLGFSVEKIKRRLVILVAAAVGMSVAVAGSIAFVGLVVPHIMRLMTGPNHRSLLPLSALGGAILLIVSDLAARTWLAPAELPVGLLTAMLGAPFFIYLLMHRREYGMAQ